MSYSLSLSGNEDYRYGDGYPIGIQKMGSTLHWGMRWDDNRFYLTGLSRYTCML